MAKNHENYDEGRGATIKALMESEETTMLSSKEEEYELLEIAQNGDEPYREEARNKLITSNLRLVAKVATNYSRFSSVPWEDIYQQGILGLYTAITKFDTSIGNRFSTYATWWIRQNCSKEANSNGLLRIPTKMKDIYTSYIKLRSQYMQEFGVEPTLEEMAIQIGVTENRLKNCIHYGQEVIYLDSNTKDKSGQGTRFSESATTIGDLLEDNTTPSAIDVVHQQQVKEELARAMATLTEKELYVFQNLYDAKQKQKGIKTRMVAEGVGKNLAEITRIYNNAVAKLRTYIGENPLEID